MATEQAVWQPDWAVPPGEILAEALQDRGMSQSDLARRMDRPVKTINEIVNGKAAITPDTAIQLERATGISARLWNGLETQYREHQARQRAEAELEQYADWAKGFPVTDLVRHDVIPSSTTKGGRVAALLSFFRTGNPSVWERQWLQPKGAYRASPSYGSSPKAVAAWLRWGEVEVEKVETTPFNAGRFREVVKEVRTLTRREPFLQIIDRVTELCASAGVVLVLTPELPGTRLSGVARWLAPDRALIQLSLRHKTDDQFWFTFFHEAGHILEGDGRDYVDIADEPETKKALDEQAADTFARNTLIRPEDWAAFVARGDVGEEAVKTFAKAQEIPAGVVVGRLHREDLLDRSHLVSLKKPIQWPKPLR
jgi:addiction module HigA family antidote